MAEIRIAADSEKQTLLDILVEKSAWLKSTGMPLWDPEEFTLAAIDEKYSHPSYVIGYEDGEPFGGLLLPDTDRAFWPEKTGNDAFYVHKLVVRTSFAGRGLAGRLLDWTAEYALARGKTFLRLDYNHAREYLDRLYRAHGFVPLGRVATESGRSYAKAESRLR